MRRVLMSCGIVLGVLGALMLRAGAEPQGGAAKPPASRRPAPPAAVQPPPEFTAAGFAELATRLENLQKEHVKLQQHLKGQAVQFSDCARVGFKTVQSGASDPFSCPDNKVIQSIYVGQRSSGVAAFRLELDVTCCAASLKAAPPPAR